MRLVLAGLFAALAVAVWSAAPAQATIGYDFTTYSDAVDGPGHCRDGVLDGLFSRSCNIYDGKAYAWLSGDASANYLLPDGKYFFAVLVPNLLLKPNDAVPVTPTDRNLSDEHTTHQQRTFTVDDGRIVAYDGPHQKVYDPATKSFDIRLSPFADTSGLGGVYVLAICSKGTSGTRYPVSIRDCRFDAFRVTDPDTTAPACPDPILGTNADGQKTVTQHFVDTGGIDSIEVVSIVNATFELQNFFIGTAGPAMLNATKIDQSQRSFIRIVITDVAGNKSTCDPVLKSVRSTGRAGSAGKQVFGGLGQYEDVMTIRNGRPGLRRVAVVVNGRRFATLRLRDGQMRKLSLRAAMRPGHKNTVVVRPLDRRRGTADVMISNREGKL